MSTIRRVLPKSHVGRDRALSSAKDKNDSIAAPDRFLTSQTQTRLNTNQPLLKTTMQAVGTALALQSGSTAGVELAKGLARIFISHFIQVFNFGIIRSVYAKEERGYYQLDISNDLVPALVSDQEVLQWGSRIASGDAARVAAGGAAMSNPTAAQVDTMYLDFKSKNTAQSGLKDNYDNAQQAVIDLSVEVDKVIKKIWDEVETFYNEEEASSKRRKSREWGVVYVSDVEVTYNLLAKDSATSALLAGVNIELRESSTDRITDANGAAVIVSNVSDQVTFRFRHPDYVLQDKVVDISSGALSFDVVAMLVHN